MLVNKMKIQKPVTCTHHHQAIGIHNIFKTTSSIATKLSYIEINLTKDVQDV